MMLNNLDLAKRIKKAALNNKITIQTSKILIGLTSLKLMLKGTENIVTNVNKINAPKMITKNYYVNNR